MWYSGSLQKFITALWAIRCAELFVESHRQHNGKYIFVPLPFYGNFAGMVRDNRAVSYTHLTLPTSDLV